MFRAILECELGQARNEMTFGSGPRKIRVRSRAMAMSRPFHFSFTPKLIAPSNPLWSRKTSQRIGFPLGLTRYLCSASIHRPSFGTRVSSGWACWTMESELIGTPASQAGPAARRPKIKKVRTGCRVCKRRKIKVEALYPVSLS